MSTFKATKGVDTHAHIFSAAAPAVPGARYRPAYAAERDAWRSQWPALGITHGVVVQPSFYGADNREMLDTIASDAKHLRGVAVVVPQAVDEKTLARFHRGGVRAIRLNLRGVRDYLPYASQPWRALYTRIHELGWHVECFIDTGRLPELVEFFDGSPVTVVFDHFGAPGRDRAVTERTFAAVRRLGAEREVWCKFSAPYRLEGDHARDHAKRWLDAVGPERIVWGSDWPGTGFEGQRTYRETFECLGEWVAADLAPRVLWDNAARLYGFE